MPESTNPKYEFVLICDFTLVLGGTILKEKYELYYYFNFFRSN